MNKKKLRTVTFRRFEKPPMKIAAYFRAVEEYDEELLLTTIDTRVVIDEQEDVSGIGVSK